MNGAIAFLDVLGWKGIWMRRPDPIGDLRAVIADAQKTALTVEKRTDREAWQAMEGLKCEVVAISDTLVLSVAGDVEPAVGYAAVVCARILASALEKGLPMRGAIGYGSYTLDGTILVGAGVDEVAAWYETTEWIGVHLTPSAFFRLNPDTFRGLQKFTYHQYSIPMKSGKPIESMAVAWPRAWRFDLEQEPGKRRAALMERFLAQGPLLPEVATKLMNTIKFYDEVIKDDPREAKERSG